MIKTTWGNSLMQVGFVRQNEGQDRRGTASVGHWSTEKQSEEDKSEERGGGKGRVEASGAREGDKRISICGKCDGRKESVEWRIGGWGPSCPVCRYREIAPESGAYKTVADLARVADHPSTLYFLSLSPLTPQLLSPPLSPAPISSSLSILDRRLLLALHSSVQPPSLVTFLIVCCTILGSSFFRTTTKIIIIITFLPS